MNQTTLGSTIRYLRKKHGLTQAMLAERLNVTDKAVSKWERDLSYPDITLLPKLSAELEVTLEDLLKEYIDNEKPRKLYRIFEMSHDVRTPLHIILGCADMAITYRDDPKRLMRYLKNIRISGEYLLGAIERIARFLDYSVHTVNTYKTRVKNKATVENDLFEQYIMKIE